jgi:hypothetical protein
LAPYQSIFMLISLPILLSTPFLIVRNIRKSNSCATKQRT